jgi:hypothetical protein
MSMTLERIQQEYPEEYKYCQKAIEFLLEELNGLLGYSEDNTSIAPAAGQVAEVPQKKLQSRAIELLDAYNHNINYPAQITRALLHLKSVYSELSRDQSPDSSWVLSKAAKALDDINNPLYCDPAYFIYEHQSDSNPLIEKFGYCSVVSISDLKVMHQDSVSSLLQQMAKEKRIYKDIESCLARNQEPNDNLNKLRLNFKWPQILPEGALYAGEASGLLSPEEAYILDNDDIHLGLELLRQKLKSQWSVKRNNMTTLLMPTVFTVTFKDNEPEASSNYVEFGQRLCSLLRDKSLRRDNRLLIAGILHVDANHYINYFVSPHPINDSVTVFILNPSLGTQQEKGRYTRLFLPILTELYKLEKSIHLVSVPIIQQLLDYDCGFLSLQNLEDTLIRGKVFDLDTDSMKLTFVGTALTVNGNRGKIYDFRNEVYCYPKEFKEKIVAVRQRWSADFSAASEVPYYALKSEPSLKLLVDEQPFRLQPYDYKAKVIQQHQVDQENLYRDAVYNLFCSLECAAGEFITQACSQQFIGDLRLPTESEISGYVALLKSRMSQIEIKNRIVTLKELEAILGPLENVVIGFIVDQLNGVCLEAIATPFFLFYERYQWPPEATRHDVIYQDFLKDSAPLAAFRKLPGAMTDREIIEGLKGDLDDKIKEKYLFMRFDLIKKMFREGFSELLNSISPDIVSSGDVDAIKGAIAAHLRPISGLADYTGELRKLGMRSLYDLVEQGVDFEIRRFCREVLPVLLSSIEHEKSIHSLRHFSEDLQQITPDLITKDSIRFLITAVQKEPLLEAIRKRTQVCATEELQRSFQKSSLSLNFVQLLALGAERWRQTILEDLRPTGIFTAIDENDIMKRIDTYYSELAGQLLASSIDTFLQNAPISLRKLHPINSRHDARVRALFLTNILMGKGNRSASVENLPQFQVFKERLLRALEARVDEFNILRADFIRLQKSIQSLQQSIDPIPDVVKTFDSQLSAHIEHCELLCDKKMTLTQIEKKFKELRHLALAELNQMLLGLLPLYESGSTDHHHPTYCLRPFLCQVYGLNMKVGGKLPAVVTSLDQYEDLDEHIISMLSGGNDEMDRPACQLRALPSRLCSNVPLLPQSGKLVLENTQQGAPTVGLILSVVHLLGSDQFYNDCPWNGLWGSCAQPLKNELMRLLEALPVGTTVESLLPQNQLEKFKAIFKQASDWVCAKKFKEDKPPILQILNALNPAPQVQNSNGAANAENPSSRAPQSGNAPLQHRKEKKPTEVKLHK